MALDPRDIAVQGIGASPRLVAVQGLWPEEVDADEDDDQTAFGPHRRRSWRPDPFYVVPPRKRKKRRRREELLFLGR